MFSLSRYVASIYRLYSYLLLLTINVEQCVYIYVTSVYIYIFGLSSRFHDKLVFFCRHSYAFILLCSCNDK